MKTYIGDSVYVEFDGFALTLTTDNGLPSDPSNTIVLDPAVYHALVRFAESLKQKAKKPTVTEGAKP